MADNVTIPGTGAIVAADEVGGALYQRMKRSAGADGSASDFLDKASRSDTYTGAGNGTAVDLSAVSQAMAPVALQVKGTGATPTAWNVVVEGSLDGTNYTTIATHVNTLHSDGQVIWIRVATPVLYLRTRCVSVTLGSATNVVATVLAVPRLGGGLDVLVSSTLRAMTGIAAGSHVAPAMAIVDASGIQVTSFGGTATTVSTAHIVAAASTNAQNIKASAGTLYGLGGFNAAEYPVKVCFHNSNGTPTAGTGVVWSQVVQAGSRIDLVLPQGGRAFATGIALTIVKVASSADLADSANTAIAANDCQFEVSYA